MSLGCQRVSNVVWMLMLAITLVVLAGCSTTDPENTSERPWNAPQGFETGIPSGLYEGR